MTGLSTVPWEAPILWVVRNTGYRPNQLLVLIDELQSALSLHVLAIDRKHQPGLCLESLCLGIRKFADEGSGISSLAPRLGDMGSDRAGRSTDLISQRELLFSGESFGKFEYLHSNGMGSLIVRSRKLR